jgi:hypothetical protein
VRARLAVSGLFCGVAAGVALLVVELNRGAESYGAVRSLPACASTGVYPGGGFDAALQRIAISGLYGAACELGATREELVLSFVPSVAPKEIRWDRETVESAVRAGLLRAIDDAEREESIGDLTAAILREVVERAPLDWLLDRAGEVRALLGD